MAARPRIRKRANWPEHLHEPRPGYFVWRDPRDGKTHVLGRMPLAQAMHEAQEANMIVEKSLATRTLAERLTEQQKTIADLIERMPTDGVKASTLQIRGYIDGAIKKAIGNVKCAELTTKQVADFIEPIIASGKKRWAQSIRNRLMAIVRRGNSLGWMTGNPVTETERPKPKTKRRRLTFEEFQAIYEKAPEVNDWLQNAMLLALVSGQDRSTIGRWQRSFSSGDVAVVQRSKTSVKIEIPLALRLDAIGMSLGDVIAKCKSTGVVSKYLIHHIRNQGRAKTGTHVKLGSISQAFADARTLAGIKNDDSAPTFHELRSLSKRLYDAQRDVDTKALLGHMTDAMAEMYADSRGIAPIKVTIGERDGTTKNSKAS
ncbi:tyrosine-type recombinase/integrase [Caballeronia sp. ATUFL_M1_KS5A]|uniref:tyrosine-type recombinase/integrase n=1 Tax=Caballeronia sp. ATUFL_M1_KS5A TaxID=2921778 RepID=UPI0020285BAD|nr:tyrosine-type recombinase/integrase [Caballeronia sp. ATUFL_M1_KS5A]